MKSDVKIMMEKSLISAVWYMASESLDPDSFESLEDIIESLYRNRGLGDCELTDYKI